MYNATCPAIRHRPNVGLQNLIHAEPMCVVQMDQNNMVRRTINKVHQNHMVRRTITERWVNVRRTIVVRWCTIVVRWRTIVVH